jgi:hypothetical protein
MLVRRANNESVVRRARVMRMKTYSATYSRYEWRRTSAHFVYGIIRIIFNVVSSLICCWCIVSYMIWSAGVFKPADVTVT